MDGVETVNEGFLVKIKGCKLHGSRVGKKNGNNPTVVMDAGYGDYSKAWNKVVHEIAKHTEVVLYDRAGLGRSDKSSSPRTSEQMVIELKELLTNLNIKPPYILVGHSFGGVNMRLYATEYSNEVSGLVLVDSTHEDYRERFLPTMSLDFQNAYKKQFVYESNYDEFMESLKQVKKKSRKLNVPLIIISAGKKAHYSAQSQELWNEMQKELLNISTNSKFILANNSAHYIQDDEPSIVIDAVRQLLIGH